MFDVIQEFFSAVANMFVQAAPFLLAGFFIAGLIKVLLPERLIHRLLGRNNFESVTFAALFGAPLPLCSCSVLPAATTLRKSGASKGATASFLISTPETGVDSIGVTWALLDPIMTLLRPLCALVTAITTGLAVNLFVKRGWEGPAAADSDSDEPEPSCCSSQCSEEQRPRRRPRQVLGEASSYSFGTLMDDLTGLLLIGFLLSGVILVAIPDGFFEQALPSGWLSSLLMVLVATPMYICATSATPIAVALIAKGLDPGAALVLLLAGPATNVTTMLVVNRLLGKRLLALYLACVVGLALGMGALANAVYAEQGIELAEVVASAAHGGSSALGLAMALVFLLLMARSAWRTRLHARWGQGLRRIFKPLGIDPLSRRSRSVLLIALGLGYLGTAVSIIAAGEVGWVQRFGRVVRTLERPGLYLHMPAPFESVTRLRVQEVRSLSVGHRDAEALEASAGAVRAPGPPGADELAAAAEVMDGEENLLNITYAVHFAVDDAYRYRFRVESPQTLVRALAASALRRSAARRSTSAILVTERLALEREAHELLQAELETLESGIRITAFALRDVHAAAAAHYAFRDVASALEDKARRVRQAEGYQVDTLARARARAHALLEQAAAYRSEKVELPTGEATAFRARLAAYRRAPALTVQRMFFETAERALSRARTILLLGADVRVELWNRNDKSGTRSPFGEVFAPGGGR